MKTRLNLGGIMERPGWPVRRGGRTALFFLILGCAAWIVLGDRQIKNMPHQYDYFQNAFYNYQNGVVDGSIGSPYAYRVLIPFSLQWSSRLLPFLELMNLDLLLKCVLLIVLQYSFWFYLREFMAPWPALAGVLVMNLMVGYALTFVQGPSVLESTDLFNLLVTVLALWGIYRRKWSLLVPLLFVAVFNRETPLLLWPIILCWQGWGRRGWLWPCCTALAVMIPYLGLRLFLEVDAVDWVLLDAAKHNIPFLAPDSLGHVMGANLKLLILLGPLGVIGFARFREQPKFLRAATTIILPFFAVHYLVGSVMETRLWMPLFPVLIPLALVNLDRFLGADTPNSDPSLEEKTKF